MGWRSLPSASILTQGDAHMTVKRNKYLLWGLLLFWLGGLSWAGPAPDLSAKVQAKMEALRWLSTDAQVVAAVRAHNDAPSPQAQAMTNEAWTQVTLLDPLVKSLAKNALVDYLKSKKDPAISELFVSGADGTKVAFFAKTSSWSHKGKAKHEQPMQGKDWTGSVEVDESTGAEQIQIGLPVLDGGKPIGSVVIGLAIAKMN